MAVDYLKADWVVIGAGLAGFAAAVALKERGEDVLLVTQSVGATSVSSGAWDFGPVSAYHASSFEEQADSDRWQRVYRSLLVDRDDLLRADTLRSDAQALAETLSESLEMAFSFKRPFSLPTSAGGWKRCYAVQELQSRADLAHLKGKRVGLVAGRNWRLPAERLAFQWREEAKAQGVEIDLQPFWVELPLNGPDWALPHLAARLNADETLRHRLRENLYTKLQKDWRDFLLFPPLFLDPAAARTLQADLAVPLGECLATTEPVAGERLSRALAATLDRLKLPAHSIANARATVSGDRVRFLHAQSTVDGRWITIEGKDYLLATGKFFGGGLWIGTEGIGESLFHLPLFAGRDGQALRYRAELPSGCRSFAEEQPWARLGVWLDRSFRPRGEDGAPVFSNLRACGSLIGGVDYARENLGLGFMAYSGRRCAALDA